MKTRVLWLAAMAAFTLQGCARRQPADLILFGGTVITVDDAFSIKSTVVVKDGKVLAVGDDSLASRYEAPVRIDLSGKSLMPGFNDNHIHPGSRSPRSVDAAAARSVADIQEMVRAKAKELGPGQWITGYGWAEVNLKERRNLNRADLDAAAPENPVYLSRAGGHSAVGNSLALKLAGIERHSANPLRGVIERDAHGDPNGIIRERVDIYTSLVPEDDFKALRPSLVQGLRALTGLGLTSINIASASLQDEITEVRRPEQPNTRLTFKQLQDVYGEQGDMLPRATVQISFPGAEALAAYPHRTGYGDDRLKLGAIGEAPAVDGGFTGPTAWTTEEYNGQPGFHGQAFFNESDLQALADDVARNGWQLGLHAIGDAAIDMAVKVYAQALQKHPQKDHRWYLAHFTMLPKAETMATMVREGILANAQPDFLYTLENRYVETLRGAALEHVNPVAVPAKAGVFVSFGSDNLPMDPRVGLYAAVTRRGQSGKRVYGPEEAVSVQDAIRRYTHAPAFITYDEAKKGSIEPGKFADFIVLDRNPLTIPPEELLTMKIERTFIGGKQVFEAK